MTYTLQNAARHHIESRFRAAVDRDLSGLAADECHACQLLTPSGQPAALLCLGSHGAVSDLLFQHFNRRFHYNWQNVVYVYDSTRREQTRYLRAKLELIMALAESDDEFTASVEQRLEAAVSALIELWHSWAGYQATTTDDLAKALDELG